MLTDADLQKFLRIPDVTPEDLRSHASDIVKGTVPVVRAAALLEEAASSAENWMKARERARAELNRLYDIEAKFKASQRIQ